MLGKLFICVLAFMFFFDTADSSQVLGANSSHLPIILDFFKNLYSSEDNLCLELLIGFPPVTETGRGRVVVDLVDSLDQAQIVLTNKCYLLITTQEYIDSDSTLADFDISGYKPTLVFVLVQKFLTIKFKDSSPPLVQYSEQTQQIIFRNEHGIEMKGVWSHRRRSPVFKGVDELSRLHGHQNKHIRITYNQRPPKYAYKNETNHSDGDTFEGAILKAYIDRRNLSEEYVWGEDKWGNLDPATNTWNGMVAKVGQTKEADIGVTDVSITEARNTFISYSAYVGEDVNFWITKYPGKRSPSQNILKVFDWWSWIAILISLVSVALVTLFIVKVDVLDSKHKTDTVLVLLMPLAILNAEAMPKWFQYKLDRVFSGSIMLLVWGVSATVLGFAFSCNLRSSLLKPVYDAPIDSSEQIVKSDKDLVVRGGTLWQKFLETAPNPWHNEAVHTATIAAPGFPSSIEDLITRQIIIIQSKVWMLKESQESKLVASLPKPVFSVSKEMVRPYYNGWILRKESIWADDVNLHILICHQAGFDRRIYSLLGGEAGGANLDTELERMSLEHVAIPFVILIVGLALSLLGFISEKICCSKPEKD